MELQKNSKLPYYLQIRDFLISAITSGEYPPGSTLPGETLLADRFGVTRMTVRQALAEVRQAGYITTDKGRGSRVVAPRVEQSLLSFYSFGRRFGVAGETFTSRLIEGVKAVSDPLAADHFGGEPCYRIVRLRSLSELPFILERAYIPVSGAPGLLERDLEHLSLYDVLEKEYGQFIGGATEYLEPRTAVGPDADLLGIPGGFPVFFTERHTRNVQGELMEVRLSLIRGDRIRFATELPPQRQ